MGGGKVMRKSYRQVTMNVSLFRDSELKLRRRHGSGVQRLEQAAREHKCL